MESSVATQAQPPEPLQASSATRTKRGARAGLLARTVVVADLLAASAAAATALLAFGDRSAPFVGLAAVTWIVIAFSFGLYATGDDLRTWVSGVSEVPRALVAALAYSWPLFGASLMLDLASPGATTLWTLGATVLFVSAGRAAVRAGLHRMPELRQRTLILGSGLVAGHIADKLNTNGQFGLEAVGLVDEDVHEVGNQDLPVLGGFADLDAILRDHQIDRVIIAFSRASHEQLLQSIRACRDYDVAVDVIPRLFEFLDGVRALDQVGGLPVLSIGARQLSRSAQIAKRALDLLGAGALLLILSPLMLAITIAIPLESRGPAFFRQRRTGRHGRPFELVKFRSMYTDADGLKEALTADNDLADGVMFKIHSDPRITGIGRMLRRFSFDELPQLFNVLKGEMSLVGPRPLVLPESEALQDWHLRRLELRPGLTGPWQIYGRSGSPFQEMVRFDYQYVAGWSLARDVEILLATVPAVISGRGAY